MAEGGVTKPVRERMIGMHHIGMPVRSMEASLAWYQDVFGLEPEFIQTSEGPDLERTVQLPDPKLRFAFLPLPNVILELLEYERPAGADFTLRNCDVGAIHLCLEVDDIDHVHRFLADRGVDFSIAPTPLTMAPVEGHSVCYFRDPDGIQLELWQRPIGDAARPQAR